MKPQGRWVFDTNTLISHLLLVGSVPNRAVGLALQAGQLLVSDETLGELEEVLARPKFNKYLSRNYAVEEGVTVWESWVL